METEIKVGDLVQITRSSENWHSSMDKLHGKIVEVTRVRKTMAYHGEIVDMNNFEISFIGGGRWSWNSSQGHFKLYKDFKERVDDKLKELL